MRKIIFLLLTINLYSYNLCYDFKCDKKELFSYRKNFSNSTNLKDILNLSKENFEKKINNLKNKKNKIVLEKKLLFIYKMLLYSKKINNLNKIDAITIKKYIAELSIKEINIKEVFNNLQKKYKKLVPFIVKNNNSKNIQKRPWNYLGPYIEVYNAICENKLSYYRFHKKVMNNKTINCKFKILNTENIKSLLNMIDGGDKLFIKKNRKKISPFVAKYILSELIDIKLKNNNKKRLKFWKSIINKSDYSEFTCGKFCNVKSPYYKRDVNKMIVHMGYQLLNSVRGSNIIEKYTELENKKIYELHKNSNTHTLGIECSLIIQRAIERTNIGNIKGRLKTTTMKKKLSLGKKPLFKRAILDCEKQLEFGDLVKLKGHVFVFLGYTLIDNKYYITTIEALGGDLRSLGVFYREFNYENNPKLKCQINKKWDNKKNILKEPYHDEIFRIYKLK